METNLIRSLLGFNYLYSELKKENFHLSHQKLVTKNMETYVLQKYETYILLNLKLTILNLQKILKVLYLISRSNGKILFVGFTFSFD